MSANSTFPPTTDRESAGIDLTLALVSLGQALRVVTLAHAGTSGILEYLPRDTYVEDLRERTEDSLVLFGLALRLVAKCNQTVSEMAARLIKTE